MKVTITIETDNAAFDDGAGYEVSRILTHAAKLVKEWPGDNAFKTSLRDINGNTVGKMEAT